MREVNAHIAYNIWFTIQINLCKVNLIEGLQIQCMLSSDCVIWKCH